MKQNYITPEAEVIIVKTDKVICASLEAEPIHWDDEEIEF